MEIDNRLLEGSESIATLTLCELRLKEYGDLDWFLLVPKRENTVEWCDLTAEDQNTLTQEINLVCTMLKTHRQPDKINVASLGNIVPQLHIHVMARYKTDNAWPEPLWGSDSSKPFNQAGVLFWRSVFASV